MRHPDTVYAVALLTLRHCCTAPPLPPQAELTKLSMLKATVDDTKGKTLNEISRIVADINVTLRDKKASLAPQVRRLRYMWCV